jgi:hypothetical protein
MANSQANSPSSNIVLDTSFDVPADGNVIDSADIDQGKPRNILLQLLDRMSPRNCLGPIGGAATCHSLILEDDVIDFDDVMPGIVEDVRSEGKKKMVALHKLYQMTDRERKQNRVPVVCTTKWDTIGAVASCVTPEADPGDRRQALLLLNNLSIPIENKASIVLGEPVESLLPALLKVIHERLPESYLAAACLFNLSYLEDAKQFMFTYIPTVTVVATEVQSQYHYRPRTLENPGSLLRILESLLRDYAGYLQVDDVNSVEGEAVRWVIGVLRNLATVKDNAIDLIQQTVVPALALQFLETTTNELSLWSRDSLEDSCLMLTVNLVQSCPAEYQKRIDRDTARKALGKIHGKGGIHDMRATAVLRLLEEETESLRAAVARQDEKKEFR